MRSRGLLCGLFALHLAGVGLSPVQLECRRGTIGWLPSGSARVKVYAGGDQLTGKKLWLPGTIAVRETRRETEREAEREAEKALTRLLNRVDERRSPRTEATVDELLEPRRCRDHCRGQRFVQHRTEGEHVCDEHSTRRRRVPRPNRDAAYHDRGGRDPRGGEEGPTGTSLAILRVNALGGLAAHLARFSVDFALVQAFRVRNTSAVVTTRTTVPIDSTTSVVGANW